MSSGPPHEAAGASNPVPPRGVIRWLRLRARLRRWLPEREWRLTLIWAGIAGLLSALCVAGFRAAIHGLQWVFTQDAGGIIEVARSLPTWRRLATPAVGGFLSGLVVLFGLGFTGRRNATDYMEALAVGDGVIRARPVLLRSLASLFTISSGGSVGREGAMVQLAATVISALGRLFHLQVPRLPLLVACGAAGAVASTYNAPIAGALFIAEIVLGSIAMESFGPLLIASTVSVLTSHWIFGSAPLFGSHEFRLVSPGEIVLYLILGVLLGYAAPAWVRALRLSESAFSALALPMHARLGLGGLIVGSISLVVPEVWGNGYEHVREILSGEIGRGWSLLLILLLAKFLATMASVGSGAVGGVLTPSLLIGGMGGLMMGTIVHRLLPESTASPEAYALVGMGAFLAGVTRAPLTAILLVFEMTLDYDIVLSLMVSSVASYYVARGIMPESIYTRSLRRQEKAAAVAAPAGLRVRDVMRPPPPIVRVNATFEEIARRLSEIGEGQIAVVGTDDRLVGSILLPSIQRYLDDPLLARLVTAGDVVYPDPDPVTSDQFLGSVLDKFRTCPGELLMVVDDARNRTTVGCLAKTDVILSLAHGSRIGARPETEWDPEASRSAGRIS